MKNIYMYRLQQIYTEAGKSEKKRLVEVGRLPNEKELFTRYHDCFAGYFIIASLPNIYMVYNLAGEVLGSYVTEFEAEQLFLKLLYNETQPTTKDRKGQSDY